MDLSRYEIVIVTSDSFGFEYRPPKDCVVLQGCYLGVPMHGAQHCVRPRGHTYELQADPVNPRHGSISSEDYSGTWPVVATLHLPLEDLEPIEEVRKKFYAIRDRFVRQA